MRRSLLTTSVVLLGLVVFARSAHAELPSATAATTTTSLQIDPAPKHGAKWVIEVAGPACEQHRSKFTHDIALACEAMGTCRVVPREEAELEATLHCDEGTPSAWRLQTRTVEGTALTSLELSGSIEDRFREAAIEVARDAAPERTLAAETLRNTLGDEGDKVKLVPKTGAPVFTMAFSGLASVRESEAGGFGAHVAAGYRLASVTHLMANVVGAGGGSGVDAFRRVRGGAGIAFGAPFTDNIVGVAFDGGIDGTQSYSRRFTTQQTSLGAQTEMAGYVQQTITLQVPLKYVRPFASFSIALVSTAPVITAAADLGVAIPIF